MKIYWSALFHRATINIPMSHYSTAHRRTYQCPWDRRQHLQKVCGTVSVVQTSSDAVRCPDSTVYTSTKSGKQSDRPVQTQLHATMRIRYRRASLSSSSDRGHPWTTCTGGRVMLRRTVTKQLSMPLPCSLSLVIVLFTPESTRMP